MKEIIFGDLCDGGQNAVGNGLTVFCGLIAIETGLTKRVFISELT
jgi:hypothetical protein